MTGAPDRASCKSVIPASASMWASVRAPAIVTSPSVAASLNHTLSLAVGAPNANARAAHLNKMIKDINKEIGKSITAAQAATLINLINQLY